MSKCSRSSWVLATVLCTCAGLSCSSESGPSGGPRPAAGGAAEEVKIQGAGASFPAPLYMKWFKAYGSAHPGVQINYQSVGSGTGVKPVIDKTVDFGASDAAMTPEEMEGRRAACSLLPMTAGSIVLAYNLEGVDDLKLTREAYVGIFLGKITKWNDAKIAAANPGRQPARRQHQRGRPRRRQRHDLRLHEAPQRAERGICQTSLGTNKQPNWPVGTKANSNDGVAACIKTTPGSIGYIEYGYAKLNHEAQDGRVAEQGGQVRQGRRLRRARPRLAAVTLPEDLIAWLPDPDRRHRPIRSSPTPGSSPTRSIRTPRRPQSLKDVLPTA